MEVCSSNRSNDASLKIKVTFSHSVSGRTETRTLDLETDFFIGRGHVEQVLGLEEATISKQHVQLHRIVYEQGKTGISPMVYIRNLSRNATSLIKASMAESLSENCQTITLRRQSAPQLLNDGDILSLSPTVHVQMTFPSLVYSDTGLSALQRAEIKTFNQQYSIARLPIGSGAYGAVYVSHETTSARQVACKIVDLHELSRMACEETIEQWHNKRNESSHLSDDAVRSMVKTKWQKRLMKKLAQGRAELSILKDLSHPNIIGAERILMSDHTVYLFQELITGGDLWSYLDANGDPGLEDADITVVTKQLLEAVAYLHDQGIVHRDVKPENILMSSWKAGGRIVLTDFGLAKHICDSTAATSTQVRRKRMHTTVGTFEYAAPEVRLQDKSEESENGYTCAVDLWSVGAIAVLLFTAKSVSDLFPIDEVDEINMISQEISQSGNDICGIAADTEGHLPFMATCSQRDPTSRTSQQQMVSVNDLRTTGGTLICDLSDLDDAQHETWGRIASRPKDFIKRLLVLDEAKRMTAHQALAHSWLTKKYYKHVLDGVYENAVKDWKPKGVIDIERIETDVSRPGPLEDDTVLLNLLQESTSRHFR